VLLGSGIEGLHHRVRLQEGNPLGDLRETTLVEVVLLLQLQLDYREAFEPGPDHVVHESRLVAAKIWGAPLGQLLLKDIKCRPVILQTGALHKDVYEGTGDAAETFQQNLVL